MPGSVLATGLWFASTTIFGCYLRHYADYTVIYGSVGTAIALLIWLYLVSLVILFGAEFNAVRYPRYLFGTFSKIQPETSQPETSQPEEVQPETSQPDQPRPQSIHPGQPQPGAGGQAESK